MTAFTVKQEKFEGPLDLLLTLIERRQLHIGDIALAQVTDEFVRYVKDRGEFPLAESAQFAFIASTLLLIKSKALLPALSLSPEEEESIEDLERRLALLKRFRELSRHVRERFCATPLFLPQERLREALFRPPAGLSPLAVRAAAAGIVAALPKVEALSSATVKKLMSLEEMISHLASRIKQALRLNFGEFSKLHKGEKVSIIIGFLAMLELVKQGVIAVTQDKTFGEIVMETEELGTPAYQR